MKKIVLMVLSLLAISMFLAGCAQEEALAGEAFRKSTSSSFDPSLIKMGCKEIYLSDIINFGEMEWVPLSTGAGMIKNSGKSGNKFCLERGYNGCVGINRDYERTFFSTSDGSCNGVDFIKRNTRLTNCGEPLQWVKSNCATGVFSYFDNTNRDIRDFNMDESIICCNLD